MSSSAYNNSSSSKHHDRRKTQTEYAGNKRQSLPNQLRQQNTDDAKRRKIYSRKYSQTPDAWEKYQRVAKIGQGTFGEVFKAKKRSSENGSNQNQEVAMKRVIMEHEKEGFPITALREIKILQTLNRKNITGANGEDKDNTPIGYDNVVQLLEVCRDITGVDSKNGDKVRPSVFLVFEFCSHDLHGLLTDKTKVNFGPAEKKSIVQQMLQGLLYIHGRHIFHRDMKTANILVTKDGVVKLADFGLARPSYVTSSRQLTNKVVTLWYRPPELLLGDINYGNSVDMWGCGCIMAELWTNGSPILQGKEELSQLHSIVKLCGSIDETDWPSVKNLREWSKFKMEKHERKIRTKYKTLIPDNLALSLLDEMLKLNPDKRISACSALDHCWFWEEPMPMQPDLKIINQQGSRFEFLGRQKKEAEAKKQREENHRRQQAEMKRKGGSGFGMQDHTY